MHIQIPTVLLDGTVLAALSKEDMYGYALTKSYKKVSLSVNLHYIRFEKIEKKDILRPMMNL